MIGPEQDAEALFRGLSRYGGPALERHNHRLAALTIALGELNGVRVDPALTRAVAWVHDIGLMVTHPYERHYMRRGLLLVEPRFDAWGLDPEQRRVFADTILYNHSLRPLAGVHPAAEMFRRATWTEHTLGTLRHGLDPVRIREVFARWPRRGLTRILVDFARITLLHDGPSQLVTIFLPRAPVSAR